MSTTTKLKPCPICGGEAQIVTACVGWVVECAYCGLSTLGFAKKHIAVKRWNKRVNEIKKYDPQKR